MNEQNNINNIERNNINNIKIYSVLNNLIPIIEEQIKNNSSTNIEITFQNSSLIFKFYFPLPMFGKNYYAHNVDKDYKIDSCVNSLYDWILQNCKDCRSFVLREKNDENNVNSKKVVEILATEFVNRILVWLNENK